MKLKSVIVGIALCATLAGISGCKKQDPASITPTPPADQGTAPSAAPIVDTAKSAAKEVTDQATVQVKAAEQQAQSLIDRAKAFVGEQKYQEALSSLNQLTTTKITAEQQKLVDSLKAQIQAALAKVSSSNAASALGGVLGGKK